MDSYAAILLSRQPLRPTGRSPWVQRTRDAIVWLKEHQFGLVSSVGMQTWEMVTALAADGDVPLRLFLPHHAEEEFDSACARLTGGYQLDPARTEFVPVIGAAREPRAAIMQRRDRMVVDNADLLLPIAIRKGGGMSALVSDAERNGRRVDQRFRIEPAVRSAGLKLEVDRRWLRPDPGLFENRYLIHWTRGVSHPWPNERPIDFYRAVIESEVWPRSGLATLERILKMGVILASGRHMPRKTPTVSFSALAPVDFIPLMRWRARYAEMSFEPYGVGVRLSRAESIGIRKVRYLRSQPTSTGKDAERWLTQSPGKVTVWKSEQEYRHLGDLSLKSVAVEDICLFCRTEKEAARLRRHFPYAVQPLFDYPG